MSDPWLGADKLYHCVACAVATSCTFAILGIAKSLRLRTASARRLRLGLAVLSGSGAGVAKEIGDNWNVWPFCPCGASARDLAADALGVALGVLIALLCQRCCCWCCCQRQRGADRAAPDGAGTGVAAA